MSVKYICDNCGAEEESRQDVDTGAHYLPSGWYQDTKEAGVLNACKLDCAKALDEKHGPSVLTKAEKEIEHRRQRERDLSAQENGGSGE